MSNCVVTGVAGFTGFIDSHLAERLVRSGHQLTGIDRFTDHYPHTYKKVSLDRIFDRPAFHFIDADLLDADLLPAKEVEWLRASYAREVPDRATAMKLQS
jgi:nucleoside-diphosphate-sugar epimerase